MPLSPACRRAWADHFDNMKDPDVLKRLNAALLAEEMPEGCTARAELDAALQSADERQRERLRVLAAEVSPPYPDFYYRRVASIREQHEAAIDHAMGVFRLAIRDLLWSS